MGKGEDQHADQGGMKQSTGWEAVGSNLATAFRAEVRRNMAKRLPMGVAVEYKDSERDARDHMVKELASSIGGLLAPAPPELRGILDKFAPFDVRRLLDTAAKLLENLRDTLANE